MVLLVFSYQNLLGLGTDTIRTLIEGPSYIGYLSLLLIGKIFLTVICIRLGLFGGIFLQHYLLVYVQEVFLHIYQEYF